jgi:hypothetical protein
MKDTRFAHAKVCITRGPGFIRSKLARGLTGLGAHAGQ